MAGTRDYYGATVKFAMPIIANGKVYAAGQTDFACLGLLQRSFGPLGVPVNPSAVAASSREIDLTWSGTSPNADGYRIERSSDGANFSPIGATGPKVTTFHDMRLMPATTYWYRVYAINSSGRSDMTAPIQAATKPAAVTDGLVGWWTFDEGSGNFAGDLSANHDEGHIAGEVTWLGGHVGDAALSFHGAGVAPGFVAIPNKPYLRFAAAQSFSLAAWIEPANIPSKWAGWITHSTDAGQTYGICSNPANQWVFGTADDSHDIAGGTLTTGWHYLTAVQDGPKNTRTLYVDGQVVATGPAADASGSGDLWVGGAKNDEEQYVDGTIDDIRIYNRALSGEEIGQLCSWKNPPTPTITATSQNDGIHLAVADSGRGVVHIERCVDGGDWSDLVRLDQFGVDYVDHVPSGSATYRYRARATDDAGASEYSPVVQAATAVR